MKKSISKLLRNRPVAFLVGSGISRELPTGFDTGVAVVECLCQLLPPTESARQQMRQLASGNLRFEVLLGYAERFLGTRLTQYFSMRSCPNANHLFLAAALRQGIPIATTNFDRCIETSYDVRDIPFEVIIWPHSFPEEEPIPAGIYKLHGCVSAPPSVQATTSAIAGAEAGWRIDEPKTRFIGALFRSNVVIVMGYSGSDDFDINPALEGDAPKAIVWIDHQDCSLRAFEPATLKELDRVFSGNCPSMLRRVLEANPAVILKVLQGRTDEARESLEGVLRVGTARSDQDGDRFVYRDYLKTVSRDTPHWEERGSLITGMVLDHYGEHDAAYACLSSTGVISDPQLEANRQLLLGLSADSGGVHHTGWAHLERAVLGTDGASEKLMRQVSGEAWTAMGRVLARDPEKLDEAEEVLIRAIASLGDLGTGKGSPLAMIELAGVYLKKRDMPCFLEAAESALGVGVEQGLIEVECRANDLLAEMGYKLGPSRDENRRVLELLGRSSDAKSPENIT